MRISICLVAVITFSISLFASTVSSGQNIANTNIRLNIRHKTLKSALKKLQDLSGFNIFYSSANADFDKQVNLDDQKRSVADALQQLLQNTGLTYRQEGKSVIIFPTQRENALVTEITGIVRDENGQPLPGVIVKLKSKPTVNTVTDADGHFHIDAADEQEALVFSYIGYQTQEVSLKEVSKPLSIAMKPAIGSLNEIQVVGYSTTTRRLNTGSVSSITSDDITNQTVANPIQALAGRIAGVTMVQSNGLPGSNATVSIRGMNNLGTQGLSGVLPLYIVDGTPFTTFNASRPANDNLNNSGLFGANGGLSIFSAINPQDIERIDVLKDADATAIYGARGANGVIIITTKKGKNGKAQLNANVYSGIGKVGHFIDMLNTQQYLDLRKEAFKNDGVTANTTNAPDLMTWDQNAYTNWQKVLIGGSANLTDAQLNYSGGNDRMQFFTSGNYHHESTVYQGNMGDSRLSGRMTLTTNSANNKFNSVFTVNYTGDNTDLITTDLASSISLPPNYPLYNPDGSLYWGSGFINPLSNLLKQYSSTMSNFIASGDLSYSFLNGFKLKVNLGYTRNNLAQSTTNPLLSQNPSSATSNSANFANLISSNYIAEPQLNYTLRKGKSTLLALVGSTFQQNVSDGTRLVGTNYSFDALLTNIGGAGTVTTTSSYAVYKYASVFGKLNYDFDQKYIADVTFRRDASSRFGPNNQFADFGAIGGAWLFTSEPFFKDKHKILSFGKLRGSYGTTGNDQLTNYSYLSLYTLGKAYQNQSTLTISSIPNQDLKWETTRKLEFGLDLGFFNDRILLKADAYWHRSGNLLNAAIPPNQTGFLSYNVNLNALVQNKGWEFEISSTNVVAKDFKWLSAFNISFQRNKLLSFKDQAIAANGAQYVIGATAPPILRYSFGGVDPATGKAIINDLNGNPVIGITDRYLVDIGTPYYGGFDNTFNYKQFSLNFFLQFNHQKGATNQLNGTTPGSFNNQNVSVLNRWRSPGDNNVLFPGATANPGSAIYSSYTYLGTSDFFYGDVSFIKLRSASLSYNFPVQWTSKLKIANARLFVQGQNLLTFTKAKYVLDPETGNSLPPLRTIVAGLNFTFN